MATKPLSYHGLEQIEASLESPSGELQGGLLASAVRVFRSREQAYLQAGVPIQLPASPTCLTAFGGPKRAAFAAACSDGSVAFGLLDVEGALPTATILRLDGFARGADEPIGIYASRRRLSRRFDVYVVVRHWPPGGGSPTHRLHRASAELGDAGVTVGPGHDDAPPGPTADWRPVDLAEDALPSWLRLCPVGAPFGADLIQQPPAGLDGLVALPSLGAHADWPLCAAWLDGHVLWGTDADQIVVTGGETADPPPIELSGGVLCLAVARLADGSRYVAAGCHDQTLHALRLEEGRFCPSESLRLSADDTPTALYLLPPAISGWPDLLVGSRGGELTRQRFAGRPRIAALWKRIARRIEEEERLSSLLDWVRWARSAASRRSDRATLRALAALLLGRIGSGRGPEPQQSELEALGGLLQEGPFSAVSPWLGGQLAASLRRGADEADPFGRDVPVRAVAAIYRHGSFALRERLNPVIEALTRGPTAALDPQLAGLRDSALRNHWDILEMEGAEPTPASISHLGALADFATKSYLQETFVDLDGVAPREAVLLRSDPSPLLVVMGRTHLHFLRMSDGPLQKHPDLGPLTLCSTPGSPPTVLRHLRALPAGDGEWLALVGAQGGLAALVDSEGRIEDIRGPTETDTVCRASAHLTTTPDGRVRFAIAWRQGRRSFLDVYEARRTPSGLAIKQLLYEPIPTPRLTDLDAVQLAEGRFRLAAGDGATDELLLLDLDLDAETLVTSQRFPVESGVSAVRLHARPEGARALVGTRSGMLWCLKTESLEVAWAYRVRHQVRAVAVSPRNGAAPLYVVVADPDHLAVLDEDGHRRQHRRLDRRLRSARLLPPSAGGKPRLVLCCTDGLVAVLRRPGGDPERWTEGLVEEANPLRTTSTDEPSDLGLAGELARVLSRPKGKELLAVYGDLEYRRAQRLLASEAVQPGVLSAEQRATLVERASHRELAAMCAALPAGAAGAWSELLFDAIARKPADDSGGLDSGASRAVAMAEALRRVAAEAPDLQKLADRLGRVPTECHEDFWVALEAARATLAAVRAHGEPQATPLGRLLAALHVVPPDLAHALAFLVRPAGVAACVTELVRLARDCAGRWDTVGADELPLAPIDLAPLARHFEPVEAEAGLAGSLARLVRFVAPSDQSAAERWAAHLALIQAARALPGRPVGPIARLGALAARGLRDDPLPEEQWTLEKQARWLHAALERPLDLGAPDEPAIDPWERLARVCAALFNRERRDVLRAHLAEVEGRTRPRLQLVRTNWRRKGLLSLALELVPEGRRRLTDVTMTVTPTRLEALRSVDEHAVRAHLHRQQIRAGEPAVPFELEGLCDPWVRELSFTVGTHAENAEPYHCSWTVEPAPWAGGATAIDRPFPHALPLAFRRAVDKLLAVRVGVAVVAGDDVISPELIVREVALAPRTRVVDLDRALATVGPGRSYPDDLTPGAVLRALTGFDPVPDPEEDTTGIGAALAERADERLVLYPLHETAARLLSPRLGRVWRQVVAWLRRHAESKRTPAILCVLPSQEAAVLRHVLGDAAQALLPARLPVERLEDRRPAVTPLEQEAIAWFSARSRLDEATSLAHVRGAGGDLRVLMEFRGWWAGLGRDGDWFDAAVGAWARADLPALAPDEALALFVLSRSTSEVALKDLQPGMVIDQEVRSTTRTTDHRTKRLAEAGTLVDEALLRRIQSDPRPPHQVRIRGATRKAGLGAPSGLEELPALLPPVDRARARLCAAGFAREENGVLRAEPLYERAVKRAIAGSGSVDDAFRSLREDSRLVDGVELARLEDATVQTASLLTGEESPRRRDLLRAAGRVWRRGQTRDLPKGSDCVILTKTVAGQDAAVLRAPGEGEDESNDPSVRLLDHLSAARFTVVGVSAPDARGVHANYVAFTSDPTPPDYAQLQGVLETLAQRDEDGEAARGRRKEQRPRPLLVLIGPGVEPWPTPERETGVIVLKEAEVRRLLAAPDVTTSFWAAVRAHMGLTRISPFNPVGALPADSPMFVGRGDVLAQMLEHLLRRNFLILGPRQIGKTSLLNRLQREASTREDVALYRLELQGISHSDGLRDQLRTHLDASAGYPSGSAAELVRAIVYRAQEEKRTAVFLLNEVDGLLEGDRPFVEAMRGVSETFGARFVMVGYATASRELRRVMSPFYHMTAGQGGDNEGQKAFNLSELRTGEALDLVDKLEQPPLGLRWESEEERRQGRDLILELTYRIPWVIQSLCARLVGLLDDERRAVLRLDDVRRVARRNHPVLGALERTDFAELVGRKDDVVVDRAARFVLLALARARYFDARRIIDDPRLARRSPSDLSFTNRQAREIVARELAAVCSAEEAGRLDRFFREFDLEALLRGLCLTLILSPTGEAATAYAEAYCFQNHIYPMELQRTSGPGKTPADREVDALVDLLDVLRGT